MMIAGSVNASAYYTNQYGVEFSRREYNYISELFYKDYQEQITLDEYNKMKSLNLFNSVIEVKYDNNNNNISLMATEITQSGRTLRIGKSCNNGECLVSLVATWNLKPTLGSYDVIGFRTPNDAITAVNKASVKGDNYSYNSFTNEAVRFSNGFGHSVKLSSVSNLKVTTSMYCKQGVTVYGSYQHTIEKISKANSKLFTIGLGGYGNVFDFYGKAKNKYDETVGVYISL
jgi:hypothetical protein